MLGQLIKTIHDKREQKGPYVLLLGAGCSVTSGCPSARGLVEDIIKDYDLDLDLNTTSLEHVESALGRDIFNIALQKFFSDLYPSKGYWFLAELIKKGYFRLILTTNYDTCLERALSCTVGYDGFGVFIRGDIRDKRLDELVNLPSPETKIIKLHGDYRSRNMLVQPGQVWVLKPCLKETIHREIKKCGIIIIGHSMHERQLLSVLPQDTGESFWYISRGSPDQKTEKQLEKLKIKHKMDGYDFDGLFSSLAKGLRKDILENKPSKKEIEEILRQYKIRVVDEHMLSKYLNMLRLEIEEKEIKNLVFVHDPDAPGGTSLYTRLYKRFQEKHGDFLEGKNIYKVHIKGGRGKKEKERKASKLEVVKRDIPDAYGTYLLIDSVAFSGRTLEICKDYLVREIGSKSKINVRAAVIYCGQTLDENLSRKNYPFDKKTFFRIELIDAHQIYFPWAQTYATGTMPAVQTQQDEIIEQYVPSKRFSFLPRSWGHIISLVENEWVTVKIFNLQPCEIIGKHRHFVRDEIFFVLDEKVNLKIWDENILLQKGDSFRIPAGTEHSLLALDAPTKVLQICQGYHDQDEDIVSSENK